MYGFCLVLIDHVVSWLNKLIANPHPRCFVAQVRFPTEIWVILLFCACDNHPPNNHPPHNHPPH